MSWPYWVCAIRKRRRRMHLLLSCLWLIHVICQCGMLLHSTSKGFKFFHFLMMHAFLPMICKMTGLQRHETGSVFGCSDDKAKWVHCHAEPAYYVAQIQDGVPPFITGRNAVHTRRSIFEVWLSIWWSVWLGHQTSTWKYWQSLSGFSKHFNLS